MFLTANKCRDGLSTCFASRARFEKAVPIEIVRSFRYREEISQTKKRSCKLECKVAKLVLLAVRNIGSITSSA